MNHTSKSSKRVFVLHDKRKRLRLSGAAESLNSGEIAEEEAIHSRGKDIWCFSNLIQFIVVIQSVM